MRLAPRRYVNQIAKKARIGRPRCQKGENRATWGRFSARIEDELRAQRRCAHGLSRKAPGQIDAAPCGRDRARRAAPGSRPILDFLVLPSPYSCLFVRGGLGSWLVGRSGGPRWQKRPRVRRAGRLPGLARGVGSRDGGSCGRAQSKPDWPLLVLDARSGRGITRPRKAAAFLYDERAMV